ncbi:hypothetical protein ONZ45_g7813 [Pleurotus djamor]|nr:hypothetical protein ONZ45_g7813 [Pleurotus djamor]
MSTLRLPPITPDSILLCIFTLIVTYILLFTSFLRDFITSILGSSPKSNHGPFSLHQAALSYQNYLKVASNEVSRMRSASSSVPRTHGRILKQIGYPAKLVRLEETVRTNALVTDGIAREARRLYPTVSLSNQAKSDGIGRVREALKHFVRDWSNEGKEERDRMFRHILDILEAVVPEERRGKKVLVPGAGLGRLAWEISQLGFDTTANELSYYMILAFQFLLSPSSTARVNQHTLHPFAYWFSHQRSNDSLFRAVQFPDAIPRLSPTFHLSEADFLSLKPPLQNPEPIAFWSSEESSYLRGYDYIVTLFFIDTSLNVVSTIEQIHHLLRPGGTWINLGPLLWTGGAQAKMELSLEEVLAVAREVGFIFEELADDGICTRTVKAEYTADRRAMMQWMYHTEFWVAKKNK